ncbi:type IV pilus biogenesis protein PilM [Rouxiella badensis]|jgi:pilus assembly protein HofM|uniref:type IV pilus biogenesis protein PilM n=1 Tax=Rouxiella badensis TaxID=1646377 RepID=UPI0003824B57|nr:pilus assembly protein PilM [Rouxiella badensis]WAT08484.1 pilus assembly protein PilM [Rouxiella badensis]
MRHCSWYVGLDIQNDYARAIAVQRRRNGWQLRHWWQQPLPQVVMRQGILHETEQLIAILSRWRHSLPSTISLRICLPAQRIIQVRLPLPDNRLKEPHRHTFISASAAKQLPLAMESLAIDYRVEPCDDQRLIVTAARREELAQWQHCLAQARLFPEVIELTPCALQSAASAAGVSRESLLLHRLSDGWLWASPHGLPFQFGLFDDDEVADPNSLGPTLAPLYLAHKLCDGDIYYTSVVDTAPPKGVQNWSPFAAFSQMSPPIPPNCGAFAIAAGLAVRPADQ